MRNKLKELREERQKYEHEMSRLQEEVMFEFVIVIKNFKYADR